MKRALVLLISLNIFLPHSAAAAPEIRDAISDGEIEALTEGYIDALNTADLKKLSEYATDNFVESMKWAGPLEDKLKAMKIPYTADQVDAIEVSEVPYIQLTLTDGQGERVPQATSWLMLKKIGSTWKIHTVVDDL